MNKGNCTVLQSVLYSAHPQTCKKCKEELSVTSEIDTLEQIRAQAKRFAFSVGSGSIARATMSLGLPDLPGLSVCLHGAMVRCERYFEGGHVP
jgi:hypothetical protein